MDKRGQLGIIEFKYFVVGFLVGFVGGLVLTYLGTKKVLPFQIPFVCGSVLLNRKKGQLIQLEFHFLWIGALIGLAASFILTGLGTSGVLPFKMPLACG